MDDLPVAALVVSVLGQATPNVIDRTGENVDAVEPLDEQPIIRLLLRLPSGGALDIDLQAPAIGKYSGQICLSRNAELNLATSESGLAAVRPPDANVGSCPERPDDRILYFVLAQSIASAVDWRSHVAGCMYFLASSVSGFFADPRCVSW